LVPHVYKVELEHTIHMSLCGSHDLIIVNLCEDVCMTMCVHVIFGDEDEV